MFATVIGSLVCNSSMGLSATRDVRTMIAGATFNASRAAIAQFDPPPRKYHDL